MVPVVSDAKFMGMDTNVTNFDKKKQHLWDRTRLILIWSWSPLVTLVWVSNYYWVSNAKKWFSARLIKRDVPVKRPTSENQQCQRFAVCEMTPTTASLFVRWNTKHYKASISAVEPAAWIFAPVWPSSCWRHLQGERSNGNVRLLTRNDQEHWTRKGECWSTCWLLPSSAISFQPIMYVTRYSALCHYAKSQ